MSHLLRLIELAWKNANGNTFRSWTVVICAALMAGLAVSSTIVIGGAQDSLQMAVERLGADVIVVPAGAEHGMENAFLMGVPMVAWIPGYVNQIAALSGVEAVSRRQMIGVLRTMLSLLGLIWALTLVFLGLVFAVTANERRWEIGVLRAIGLSHIITAFVKAYTGRLSALCGCSIAAGAGATAGITWLLGGSLEHIAGAIKNLIEDLAGVICDGAKVGCSLKLATAAGGAVQAALFALQGVWVPATDGIIGFSPEETMQNIGTLSTQGMVEADRTILRIMMQKQLLRAG